ncbi:M15 family peptidase, partial [Paraburkholderia sp. SIMBA_049]
AVAVAALLLLPGIRATVFESVAQFHGRMTRRANDRAARTRSQIVKSATATRGALSGVQNLLVRRRLMIMVSAGILATPPL